MGVGSSISVREKATADSEAATGKSTTFEEATPGFATLTEAVPALLILEAGTLAINF